MIIANICGGLGNQMFQFAHGYALSKKLGRELALCTDMIGSFNSDHNGFELARVFKIAVPVLDKPARHDAMGIFSSVNARKILSKDPIAFIRPRNFIYENAQTVDEHDHASSFKNIYLQGYWQSEDYFTSCKDDIHQAFKFVGCEDEPNRRTLKQISETQSLAIHVRRGDYVSNAAAANLHGVPSVDYYIRAINYVIDRVGSVEVFAFSDDQQWVRDFLAPHYPSIKVVDHNVGAKSYLDMFLMSQCKHIVTANSTFSWWAAWLNQTPERLIVSPKSWFAGKQEPINLVPKTWIRI